MINTEDFDPSLLKIDKKSYKHFGIYYISYIIGKDSDYVKISSVTPLCLIISKVDQYITEKTGSKYFVFDQANENSEVLKKCAWLWYVIKNEIETMNEGKKGEYGKNFMKIKLDTE